MSLISRVEVSNYLTEGINPHRRSAEWKPMLTGITLRMDGGKSALVNITNGGGKTSLVEILLYVLSRDARLLKAMREKLSPKTRGYTHARIEFRTPPEDTYAAPSLLEVDPLNLPGETHVVGVALNDDVNDSPIFYSYSGTLEDSPCYVYDGHSIAPVGDAQFVATTKALRGCRWNRFANRSDWEDHIRLFLPVEVVRRNVVYQLKGADDRNASFFDFKARGGESYDSAFFRAVVAPDLLSNLLGTFAEEDESAVEDTLLKSLTRIVSAEKEIKVKEKRLQVRNQGIADLEPILAAGRDAQKQQRERDTILRALRRDIAFLRHFGVQGTSKALPGLPRKLPRMGEQDPRILTALQGMVISRDDGILLLDKTLSELTCVDVGTLAKYAERRQINTPTAKMQVVDFVCLFGFSTSGTAGGGHYRKGYPRDSALSMPELISGVSGAKTAGLKEVFIQAFAIAEAQIDTNPASHQVRALEARKLKLLQGAEASDAAQAILTTEIGLLSSQLKDRADNQGAWDDFVKIGGLLPEDLRLDPDPAKRWLDVELRGLQNQTTQRDTRRGELNAVWTDYVAVLEHHGLEGLQGARERLAGLQVMHEHLQKEARRIGPALSEASRLANTLRGAVAPLMKQRSDAQGTVGAFDRLLPGVKVFEEVFGAVDPSKIDPARAFQQAESAALKSQGDLTALSEEQDKLRQHKARSAKFNDLFGVDADPLTCDPIKRHTETADELSTVQQDLVAMQPQKEAVDQFEEMFPKVAPHSWLDDADASRARLESSLVEQRSREVNLTKEREAIEQMRSVEDGSFESAWAILDGAPLKAQRLHQSLMEMGLPQRACNDAMSALSGMLSAPVFDGIEELTMAAQLLEEGAAYVPLILKTELADAVSAGVIGNGAIRLLGFIGGATSRRVRVLLDADFARAELERVAADLAICKGAIEQGLQATAKVAVSGERYQLALKAKAALAAGVPQRYLDRQNEAARLGQQLAVFKAQILPESLEVLRTAKEFVKLGGQQRLSELDDSIPVAAAHVKQLKADAETAKVRASHENLKARDDAIAYRKLGGDQAHHHARAHHEQLSESVVIAEAKADEAQAAFVELEGQAQKLRADQEAYEQDGGEQVRSRYGRVINFAESTDDLQFMRDFEAQGKTIAERMTALIESLRVNFDRAAAFRAHQGTSDQALRDEIAKKEQALKKSKDEALSARQESERIGNAEIPSWQRLAKAVHELAYEVGSQVARTKEAAAQAEELEEGSAMPEAHASYRQAMAVLDALTKPSLQSHGAVVADVEALAQTIQDMNLQGDLQKHKDASKSLQVAQQRFETLNTAFCDAARLAVASRDAPFNTLEIDEISRARPENIEGLGTLFEQLQASLAKERDEARQAIAIATQTAEDTLTQLAGLIQSATDNLATMNKVMARYPHGRFFFDTQITGKAGVQEILNELKEDVERALGDQDSRSRGMRRGSDTQLKTMLREKLIDCVFTNTTVQFVNAGIWEGRKSDVSARLSTGQKVALEFMWIVRQAEYEIERGLQELTSKQAARSRARANRVILIDGIFSTLSDRRIIKEALNGLRDLGGNFQVIGFLHSPTWNNDFTVFPVYHVGKKLANRDGDGLVSFRERGREPGTVGFISAITQPLLAEGAG